MKLVLPLPPSPNAWPSNEFARQVAKDRYRKAAWVEAISQHRPLRDPPERVEVRSTFYLTHFRDEDNLDASHKWVLDCLKQEQRGAVRWRWERGQGLFHLCGYFVDDDPAHCTVAKPEQVKVRKRIHKRLEIEITAMGSLPEAA